MPLNDLSLVHHLSFLLKPPGYPLALAGAMKVSSNDQQAVILLYWICIFIFYGAWFVILESIKSIQIGARALMWMTWAFIAEPLLRQKPDELMALALFSLAIALSLWIIQKQKRSIWRGVALGFILGGCAFSRYAYYPLMGGFVVSWLLWVYRFDRRFLPLSFVMGCTAMASIGATMLFMRLSTGFSSPAPFWSKGFYWIQLFSAYPFPIDAINFKEAWMFICKGLSAPSPVFINTGLWISALFLLSAYLFRTFISMGIKKSGSASEFIDPLRYFFDTVGIMSMVCILGSLAYLSIRYRTENIIASEARYYDLLSPFILLSVIELLMRGRDRKRGEWEQIVVGGLLFAVSISAVNLYRQPWALINKDHYSFGKEAYKKFDADIEKFMSLLSSQKSDMATVYLEGPWKGSYWRTEYARQCQIPSEWSDGSRFISTRFPVQLIFSFPKNPEEEGAWYLAPLVKSDKTQKIGALEEVDIYRVVIGKS